MIVGTGIDIIEIARIEKAIQKEAFVRRVFTREERAYCASRANRAETLAGMFAAKEAAAKALGSGIGEGVRWQDIEIRHRENHMPYILLSDAAQRKLQEIGGRRVHVSISHSRELAVAQVIIED